MARFGVRKVLFRIGKFACVLFERCKGPKLLAALGRAALATGRKRVVDASLNPKEEDVISAKAECEAASLEVAEAYKLVECNCKDDFGLDLMCGDEPFIVTSGSLGKQWAEKIEKAPVVSKELLRPMFVEGAKVVDRIWNDAKTDTTYVIASRAPASFLKFIFSENKKPAAAAGDSKGKKSLDECFGEERSSSSVQRGGGAKRGRKPKKAAVERGASDVENVEGVDSIAREIGESGETAGGVNNDDAEEGEEEVRGDGYWHIYARRGVTEKEADAEIADSEKEIEEDAAGSSSSGVGKKRKGRSGGKKAEKESPLYGKTRVPAVRTVLKSFVSARKDLRSSVSARKDSADSMPEAPTSSDVRMDSAPSMPEAPTSSDVRMDSAPSMPEASTSSDVRIDSAPSMPEASTSSDVRIDSAHSMPEASTSSVAHTSTTVATTHDDQNTDQIKNELYNILDELKVMRSKIKRIIRKVGKN